MDDRSPESEDLGHRKRRRSMTRFGSKFVLALLALMLTGLATAQVALRGPQSSTGLSGASVSTSSGAITPGTPAPSEPKAMAGMLAAQNSIRTQLKLSPLVWSSELAFQAEATARSASEGGCARSTADKTGTARSASIYWAPGVRRVDGGGKAQDISPAFLVSEWREGRDDYDPSLGECRRSGACEQYARMVSSSARAVGCSKVTCQNQSQVWACHYSGAAVELRRLPAD
jgi:hypothetical protein